MATIACEEVDSVLALEQIGELPDITTLWTVACRLLLAGVLGGVLGLERERLGKVAGLRTHVLVRKRGRGAQTFRRPR